VNDLALRAKGLIGVDDLVGGDGVGDALNRDVSARLAMDLVASQGKHCTTKNLKQNTTPLH
jgi:hypothetical protein